MLTLRVQISNGKKYLEDYSSNMRTIREEAERQHKVIDMMLTMHAILRDRYRRWAMFMSVVLLCSSFIIVAGIFINPNIVDKLRIDTSINEFVISICSLVVFLVALIEAKVDWRGQAEKHEGAFKALQKLKVSSKELLVSNLSDEKVKERWLLINATLNELLPIPDKKFAKLKAAHLKKVEISKLLSQHPGCGIFLLRFSLLCRYFKRVLLRKKL